MKILTINSEEARRIRAELQRDDIGDLPIAETKATNMLTLFSMPPQAAASTHALPVVILTTGQRQ